MSSISGAWQPVQLKLWQTRGELQWWDQRCLGCYSRVWTKQRAWTRQCNQEWHVSLSLDSLYGRYVKFNWKDLFLTRRKGALLVDWGTFFMAKTRKRWIHSAKLWENTILKNTSKGKPPLNSYSYKGRRINEWQFLSLLFLCIQLCYTLKQTN